MNEFQENSIFICGHRKSGTTLMLNLLDNHPELSVYPADSGFFYMYYPVCEIENYSSDEKINVMVTKIIGNLEDELQNLSEKERGGIDFDIENFKKDFINFAKQNQLTPKDMLVSLSQAFKKNYKNSPSQTKWVEKTTSTEIYALDVSNWFPKSKFIHIIRDPRDNWASLKSGWDDRYKNFNDSKQRLIQSLIDRGKLGMEFAKYNEKIFGKEKYLIIKFENLTRNPRETLNEICDFLQIKFDKILLEPTVCGVNWKGNSFDGIEFRSISDVNVTRWKERIDENEAKLIEYYFADIMKNFGYELEYDPKERAEAAKEHYKWYNFAQNYSYTSTKKPFVKSH